MGVPDTTTFTLQNVVDEIDNDDNLVGCFNDAIASYFDSNYGPGDYWHNGSGTAPVVGDIVYTNATGTSTFGSTWLFSNYSFGLYLGFDGTGSAGEVTSTGLCSPP